MVQIDLPVLDRWLDSHSRLLLELACRVRQAQVPLA